MAMQLIAGISGEMIVCNVMVEVVDGTEGKENHSFPRDTSGGSPSSGVGLLIGEVIKVPSSQL